MNETICLHRIRNPPPPSMLPHLPIVTKERHRPSKKEAVIGCLQIKNPERNNPSPPTEIKKLKKSEMKTIQNITTEANTTTKTTTNWSNN